MAGDTFDAGTVVAEARLDRDQYARDVAAFKRDLVRLEREAKVKIRPTFDDTELKAGQTQVKLLRQQLEQLGRIRATPRLELNGGAAARAEIEQIEQSLRALNGRTARATVDTRSIGQANKQVKALGGSLGGIPSIAKYAAAGVALLGPASYLVVAALQMVTTAAGGLAVLPAVLGGAIGLFATLKIGVANVGDALKAAAEGDVKALDEALKKLAPSAREFVLEVQKASPAWRAMRLDVQQQLFVGLGQAVGYLTERYLPMLREQLPGIAQEMRETALQTVAFANGGRQVESVRLILANTRGALDALNPAFGYLLQILLDVAAVGSQLLPGLAGGFTEWAKGVAATVAAMRDSGRLLEIMQRGLQTIFSLAGAIDSIFGIIGGVMRAAGIDGQNMAAGLATVLQKWEDWVNSARGQTVLTDFFTTARDTLRELAPLLGIVAMAAGNMAASVGPAMPGVARALTDVLVAAGPLLGMFTTLAVQILPSLTSAVSFLAPVLGPAVALFITAAAITKTWALATTIASASMAALNTIVAIVRGGVMAYNLILAIARGNINLMALAQWALNAAWAANPIGIVVIALAALVAGLILAWNHSETFRAIVIGAWEGIKTAASVAWSFLQGVFAWIGSAAVAVGQTVAAAWSWLVGVATSVGSAISAAWTVAWDAVVAAAGVVGGALSAAWSGVVAAVQAVGQWFTWLWDTILSPVFSAIGLAARVLLAVLVTIVLAPIILAVKAVGAIFTWLWENAIQPAWNAIATFLSDTWTGVIQPILQAIGDFITTSVGGAWTWLSDTITAAWNMIVTAVTTAWNWLLTTIFQPMIDFIVGQLQASWQGWQIIAIAVWTAIQTALGVAWAFIRDTIWQPIVDFINGPLMTAWNIGRDVAVAAWQAIQAALAAAWAWILGNVLQPIIDFVNGPLAACWNAARDVAAAAWQAISDAIGAVWNWIKSNIFDPLVNFVTVTIPDAFNRAVDGIKGAWDKIQGIVRPPIDFMVNTVYNEGIVPAWNWIAGLVGLGKLEPVHFATGGMVPGSGNGDTVPAMLTPGEFVLSRPAVAAAGGIGAVDALHTALRSGARAGFQTGGPVGPNPAPNQGGLDSLWAVVTGGLSKMTSMFTGNLWGQAAIGLVKTATDRLWPFMMEKIASFFASLIGIGGGGGAGALVGGGDARAWIIAHESGGNPTARNPSSTASGLYQMINGTWKAYGGSTPTAAQASVAEQNAVADRYVAARYGSWENAQAFWQTHHYYDAGGFLPPGISTVVNNTGRPEPVLTPEQWRAITAPPAPGAVAGARPGETIDVGQLNSTMTEVRDLLERRGTGATVNVNQQSDPVATARAAVLQLRLS